MLEREKKMKGGEHMQRKEGVLIIECTLELVGVEAQITGRSHLEGPSVLVLEIEILDSNML